MTELTPSEQGFRLEKLIHEALSVIPNMKTCREQEIRTTYNDSTLNGIDHMLTYENTYIFAQDKWKDKISQQEASQFVVCVERVVKILNIPKDCVYLFWITKVYPTKNILLVLKDWNVRIVQLGVSIEALARQAVFEICESFGVSSTESLKNIQLVKRFSGQEKKIEQTTPKSVEKYDESDRGKCDQDTLKRLIMNLQSFISINMLYPIYDASLRRSIEENFLPTRPEDWYEGKPKIINHKKLLQTIEKEWMPNRQKHPRIQDYIVCCRFIYKSGEFAQQSRAYTELQEQMIKSNSEWAKKLTKIKATTEPFTQTKFEEKIKQCSDYNKDIKISSYWMQVIC